MMILDEKGLLLRVNLKIIKLVLQLTDNISVIFIIGPVHRQSPQTSFVLHAGFLHPPGLVRKRKETVNKRSSFKKNCHFLIFFIYISIYKQLSVCTCGETVFIIIYKLEFFFIKIVFHTSLNKIKMGELTS
jgi:hypothetical protein